MKNPLNWSKSHYSGRFFAKKSPIKKNTGPTLRLLWSSYLILEYHEVSCTCKVRKGGVFSVLWGVVHAPPPPPPFLPEICTFIIDKLLLRSRPKFVPAEKCGMIGRYCNKNTYLHFSDFVSSPLITYLLWVLWRLLDLVFSSPLRETSKVLLLSAFSLSLSLTLLQVSVLCLLCSSLWFEVFLLEWAN